MPPRNVMSAEVMASYDYRQTQLIHANDQFHGSRRALKALENLHAHMAAGPGLPPTGHWVTTARSLWRQVFKTVDAVLALQSMHSDNAPTTTDLLWADDLAHINKDCVRDMQRAAYTHSKLAVNNATVDIDYAHDTGYNIITYAKQLYDYLIEYRQWDKSPAGLCGHCTNCRCWPTRCHALSLLKQIADTKIPGPAFATSAA